MLKVFKHSKDFRVSLFLNSFIGMKKFSTVINYLPLEI